MKKTFLFSIVLLVASCTTPKKKDATNLQKTADLIISFGSCNMQLAENILWKEITKNNPSIWIWGGDVIYSDTDNMAKMKKDYEKQWTQKGYADFSNSVTVLGTWDDHDYGLNDGGIEFLKKNESEQLFLDFLKVPKDSPRRKQKGVYHSQVFNTTKGSVKVLVLDTRYFRSKLTKSKVSGKKYQPNIYGEGTVLGETQWNWLSNELTNSTADFNLVVSSIQVLSSEHGFESWGNFPHEVDRFKNVITSSKAKGVLILSGDRHISEFTKIKIDSLSYPLVDFTSSGLTHSYSNFSSELNPNRQGKVVSEISFGVLKFDFKSKKITMQMRGKENKLQQEYIQVYN